MTYLALARKWRPRTFSQMVGQDPIVKALTNSINHQRLHHAYLFTGTRGVGKTSVARLFAKALNCEKAVSSEPCLTCDACLAIEQGRFIDLLEIDGASRTRVEDTRELLDNIQYAPTNARFKIYLIDEVHMLSQHSFNALLKTLEEPPAHIKFLLATTDPQKLPMTVLSRCLQFNLRHLPASLISERLQFILKEEQLDFDVTALDILAHAARGSMRDALSLLDQAIASSENRVSEESVKLILGYTQQDYALHLLHALNRQNATDIHGIIAQIAVEGGHFTYVLEEILSYLHKIAVCQSVDVHNQSIPTSAEITALAQSFLAEDTQLFYQIAIKGTEEMHLAPTLVIGFTMIVLRMLTFRPATAVKEIPHTLIANSRSAIEEISSPPVNQLSPPRPEPQNQTEMRIVTNDPWATIIQKLNLTGLTYNALQNSELISQEGAECIIRVASGHASLFTPTITTRIETALSTYYQKKIKLIIRNEEQLQSTPAQQQQQTIQRNVQHAEQSLLEDPVFNQLQQDFSAELLKNSIISLKNDI